IHLFRDQPGMADRSAMVILENDRKFPKSITQRTYHDVREVWGGTFWDMRKQLGKDVVDKMLFSTWEAVISDGIEDSTQHFVRALLDAADENGDREAVAAIFSARNCKY